LLRTVAHRSGYLQPPVAHALHRVVTVRRMPISPKDFWRLCAAPVLSAKKRALGDRALPQAELAEYVESETGKRTSRGLVGLFLQGKREPYFSQFIALCRKLDVNPRDIFSDGNPVASTPDGYGPVKKVMKGAVIPPGLRSKTGRSAKTYKRNKRY